MVTHMTAHFCTRGLLMARLKEQDGSNEDGSNEATCMCNDQLQFSTDFDPGVMPIMTYGGFKRMTGFCKTHVPKDIEEALESIKDNDEAVKNFGIDLGTRMCKRILDSGTPGLHMYTLNTERSSVAILENLGLINKSQVGHLLAWTHSCGLCRRCIARGCSGLLYCTELSTTTKLLEGSTLLLFYTPCAGVTATQGAPSAADAV